MKRFVLLTILVIVVTVNPQISRAETAKKKFDEAVGYFKSGHYANAELIFLSVMEIYPGSKWADNAQLGIGLIYEALRNYTKAIKELRKVVTNYPGGDKVPNALFGIGNIYENKLNNAGAALSAYREVTIKYPQSEFAKMARTKINNLKNKIEP